MPPRALVFVLPLLLAAGCAASGPREPVSASALRFAIDLGAADQAVEAAVGRMDDFERQAARERAAIAFATGGRDVVAAGLGAPPTGVAEATGHVLNAAFTALGDYGHVLAQLAAGQPAQAKESFPGAVLAQDMAVWLDALRAAGVGVPQEVRNAGLAGVTALADLPEGWAKRPGQDALTDLVRDAQPHVAAVVALLREMLGATAQQGARAAIRARHHALDAAQARFLAAVRADRSIGPAQRYAIFRSITDLRDGDPVPGTMGAIVTALSALDQAHAALAAGGEGPDAAAKVAAFEAAVERLGTLSEASQRD